MKHLLREIRERVWLWWFWLRTDEETEAGFRQGICGPRGSTAADR